MNNALVSVFVFLSLALAGCAAATQDAEPAPPVDVQIEACNHGYYYAGGAITWYAWHDYTVLPSDVQAKGVGDTAVPYAKDDATLSQGIQDTGYAKRVTVQCGTTDRDGNVDKFVTVEFSAATSR